MPVAQNTPGGAVAGGKLWVFGGGDSPLIPDLPGATTGATYSYDPALNTWTAGPSLNVPRSKIAGSAIGNRLVAAGGYDGSSSTDTTEVLDAATASCESPTTTYAEDFDGVTPPALPTGWTAANTLGDPPLWTTSNSGMPTPPADSLPNAAFIDDGQVASDKRLTSPDIPISTPDAQLTFRNNYYLEHTFDGGVLEISIAGGAFQDIVTAGGTFVQAGYSGTLNSGLQNPLEGRMAWTGNSNNGFVTTTVDLPPAAAGQNVELRWRLGTDESIGAPGWRIDSLRISECLAPPPPPPPPPHRHPRRRHHHHHHLRRLHRHRHHRPRRHLRLLLRHPGRRAGCREWWA